MKKKLETPAAELAAKAPEDLGVMLQEAVRSVEDDLALEDSGWINLSSQTGDAISVQQRILNLKLSRLYYDKDPLGHQAVRLWTDYTFGSGLTWSVDEKNEKTEQVLKAFWENPSNQKVLSVNGQRISSNKTLVDGEIFFALFLGAGGEAKIRRIDPLEIVEIITDEDDRDDVLYYKRSWSNQQGKVNEAYYRSFSNIKGVPGKDAANQTVEKTDDALVYHLAYNTIGQRGNPLLTPALDWIRQYRRFLASRIAIMLALARFAWKTKVKGGQPVVDAIKAKTEGKEINAGSQIIENLGSDTTPIKTDSGARNAYEDGRQIKLMVFSAVGISEQYFGDISTGNLATAKTVELPMIKMFQSYQAVWKDTYKDINEMVLLHNKVPSDKWYVDMDFPPVVPADVAQIAMSLKEILTVMPEFAQSPDVMQVALMSLGINDPQEVLDALSKAAEANPSVALTRALKQFREIIKQKE